jgi:hypothetical protein
MNHSEANAFLNRWRRILIPWRAVTIREVVRDLDLSVTGMMGGGGLMMLCSHWAAQPWDLVIKLVAFAVMAWGLWFLLQLRQIRRSLFGLPN